MRLTFALLLLVLSTCPCPTLAAFCSEPSEPYCINSLDDDSDADDIENCRWRVQSFVRETESYLACLREAADGAVEKSNDVVRKYNCRARRESYC